MRRAHLQGGVVESQHVLVVRLPRGIEGGRVLGEDGRVVAAELGDPRVHVAIGEVELPVVDKA